jgi:L-galactose dehydrogenase
MEYRQLGKTGLRISELSFGAAPLGAGYGAFDEANAIRTVRRAVELGVNLIDVSPYYGLTRAETLLGKVLPDIPRDQFYLSTKLGRYGLSEFDFSAARVVSSVDESLTRLKLDYVDLMFCHDVEFVSLDQIVNETLPALERVRAQGKVRFIGISGLPLKIYPAVLDRAPLDVIISYCHYNLQDNTLARLIPYLQSKGVGIINAAPTGMGLLTRQGPPAWHLASPEIKAACAQAVHYCESRGVNIVQLAIQYALANPVITTTLVGSVKPEEIEQDIAWANTPLDTELLQGVERILAPVHDQTWASGLPENN